MTNIYISETIEANDISKILQIIPKNCLSHVLKYKQEIDQRLSLSAWYVLYKMLLKDYQIDMNNLTLEIGKNGKPYFYKSNIYFNISHSLNLIVVCISDNECGVDIECIKEKKDLDKMAKKVLSKKEEVIYNNCSDKLDYFIKMWTVKEAVFKFLTTGIRFSDLNKSINKQVKTIKVKDKCSNEYYLSIVSNSKANIFEMEEKI